jgi:hypothetical protein
MQMTYKIVEKAGMMGGRSYLVAVNVKLTDDQQRILAYGCYSYIDVGEQFKDIKGFSAGGFSIDLLLTGFEFKLPTIQSANDFIISITDGLQKIKAQMELTSLCMAGLNKEQTIEIG